jgi:hypothetical protein
MIAGILLIIFGNKTNIKYFTLFILFSVFIELIVGKLFKIYFDNNRPIFNAYAFICVGYYLYIYLEQFNKKWFRILISAFIISLLVGFYFQNMYDIITIPYNTGMILVLFAIGIYLFNLLFASQYENLFTNSRFWLAVGIIYFYSSLFPILIFVNKIQEIDKVFLGKLYRIVVYGNIFLMLGYLSAILCRLKFRIPSFTTR